MPNYTRRILLCSLLCVTGSVSVSAQTPDEKREHQLKLPEIFEAIGISEGSQVADVGAGSGFITGRMARRVGTAGRVYAVDIDEKYAIPRLKDFVDKESLTNVDVIHGEPADPKLPEGKLDAVLMVITYHEVEPHQEMLAHVRAALKPGGRFVAVDMMPRKTRARPRGDQTKNHVIAPEIAEAEFRAAGFEIIARKDDFMDRPDEEEVRWMIICRRPQ